MFGEVSFLVTRSRVTVPVVLGPVSVEDPRSTVGPDSGTRRGGVPPVCGVSRAQTPTVPDLREKSEVSPASPDTTHQTRERQDPQD